MSKLPTSSSTPTLIQFDPTIIPWQYDVIKKIRCQLDYRLGTHEILLSGSAGSAKSLLLAHLITSHCLIHLNAKVLIGRLTMPALKSTLYLKILEHIGDTMRRSIDYVVNESTAQITFKNGSKIYSRSWADTKFFKVRSLELSAVAIEELVETPTRDFYDEIKIRVGRLPHIKENFIICASNPDSPAHWAYKYFIESKSETRHVVYSRTEDNPFLPPKYVEQLKRDLSEPMVRRMIYGEWIEITSEVVYYAYDKKYNFRDTDYTVDISQPVHISFDFNIGEGKPMSCCLFQFIDDEMHIFNESVIHGARTADICEDLEGRELLAHPVKYYIHGDATGRRRDTRNKRSDYDIIIDYLKKLNIKFELDVPLSNSSIRERHNLVNGYCCNYDKLRRLFVYANAKTADEGLRLTTLKKGGHYIENDDPEYQHISTAIGYGLQAAKRSKDSKPQGTKRL